MTSSSSSLVRATYTNCAANSKTAQQDSATYCRSLVALLTPTNSVFSTLVASAVSSSRQTLPKHHSPCLAFATLSTQAWLASVATAHTHALNACQLSPSRNPAPNSAKAVADVSATVFVIASTMNRTFSDAPAIPRPRSTVLISHLSSYG